MLKSKSLRLLLPAIFTITCFTTCTKDQNTIVAVNPFMQYYHDQQTNLQVTATNNDFPFELGYTFVSSIPGYILSIGLSLPDSGYTYTVTLWDAATQAVLARENCTTQETQGLVGFVYYDLRAVNAEVAIQANHTYVISANVNPVNAPPGKAPNYVYYNIERNDQANIFPMTEGPITFLNQYTQASYTPTFPAQLSVYQNFLNGIVDIGFANIDL